MPSLFDGLEPRDDAPLPPVLEVGDRVKIIADAPYCGGLIGDVVAAVGADLYHVKLDRRPGEVREWPRGYLIWQPRPTDPGERYLAAGLRSLLVDLGLTPSGTGSEDLGLLELEVKRLRAGSPPLTPADLDNLKAIRMAVNRTAYHGGLGLRESGKMLSTLDRLLAAYGVGSDDGPSLDEVKAAQSIPERAGWPR